jgi:hypothetical protein
MDIIEAVMSELQIGAAAKDEQIKSIFVMLAEIKAMLKEYTCEMKTSMFRLAEDIDRIKGRPTKLYDGIAGTIIAAIIGGAIMYFIGGK